MSKVLRLLVVLVGITIASGAHAKCYFNGKGYDTGTQVGSLVCKPDGRWQKP